MKNTKFATSKRGWWALFAIVVVAIALGLMHWAFSESKTGSAVQHNSIAACERIDSVVVGGSGSGTGTEPLIEARVTGDGSLEAADLKCILQRGLNGRSPSDYTAISVSASSASSGFAVDLTGAARDIAGTDWSPYGQKGVTFTKPSELAGSE